MNFSFGLQKNQVQMKDKAQKFAQQVENSTTQKRRKQHTFDPKRLPLSPTISGHSNPQQKFTAQQF